MNLSPQRAEFLWRVQVVFLGISLFAIAAALLFTAANEILVLAAGLIFGTVIAAVSSRVVSRTALPYHGAFALIWVILIGFPVLFYAFAAGPISEQVSELGTRLDELGGSTASVPDWVPASDYLETQLADLAPQQLLRELIFGGQLGGVAASVLEAVASAVVLFFITFFISMSPRLYHDGVVSMFSTKYRARVDGLLHTASRALEGWMLARLISMVIVFALTYAGLMILNVELALVLAVTAGLFSFIPNIGPLLSVVPAALVAFVDPAVSIITIVLLYVAVQTVESYFVTPYFQQWVVSTPPAILLSLQVVMGVLFGFVGILLAGPLAAVAIALQRDIRGGTSDRSPNSS